MLCLALPGLPRILAEPDLDALAVLGSRIEQQSLDVDRTRSAARLDQATRTSPRLTTILDRCAAGRGLDCGPRVVVEGRRFPEVGLHQCAIEKKGQGAPVRGRPVPYHVPTHAQTAAKALGSELAARPGTGETDSPAEQAG